MSRVWKIFVITALACGVAFGQVQLKPLYSFGSKLNDGIGPAGPIVFDSHGNLYGTTTLGGGQGREGTVFELSHSQSGWSESVLYTFCAVGQCADGSIPYWGVIVDEADNLYGSTTGGGLGCQPQVFDCGGVVFEVSPPSIPGGTWTENALWKFAGNTGDGCFPFSPLVRDHLGNLYGTFKYCGLYGEGGVFRLSPPNVAGDPWEETILYNFCSTNVAQHCSDGAEPLGSLALDDAGNIFGTTSKGGDNSGTVFELSPPLSGDTWVETILYKFRLNRGGYPNSGIIFDEAGNLYGTFSGNNGGVFKLTPLGKEYQVALDLEDDNVLAGLLIQSGILYGEGGGGQYGYGELFSFQGTNKTVLHNFCPQLPCSDGIFPESPLIPHGNHLYGTTLEGGDSGGGVVYEISR